MNTIFFFSGLLRGEGVGVKPSTKVWGVPDLSGLTTKKTLFVFLPYMGFFYDPLI